LFMSARVIGQRLTLAALASSLMCITAAGVATAAEVDDEHL
jgi:hypothetical protein